MKITGPRLALALPALSIGLLLASTACEKKPDATPVPATSASTTGVAVGDAQAAATARPAGVKLEKVTRADFNRAAAELALPLFWSADANKDGALDPDELAVYWGLVPGAKLVEYVGPSGAFTEKAKDAIDTIAKRAKETGAPVGADPKEVARREAVKKELAQGRVTLVATDLSKAPPEEKRFVGFITQAAELIEKLYAKQQGTLDLRAKVPADDPASKSMFFRNQVPKCEAPQTQNDPACSAIPEPPKGKLSGLYPAALLEKPKFCDELSKLEAGKKEKVLMDPFTVVVEDPDKKGAFKAIPYHEAFKDDVSAISGQLRAAAEALGATEPALKAYLLATAQAFVDDKWWPADEAWAKMDAKNSKYYIRVAADEVYREPCSTKALYHVSFGLINQGSLKWQSKLDPLKTEMEKALADLAGAPYKAREVSFKLPDFMDVALNAGDSRPSRGATVGQSLPNFGPVANEGRGRTVAMVNFYTDPDSIEALKGTTESLFCKDTMAKYTTDAEPLLMSTVLHEAAHNLGPAHQYKTNGKIDREVFGGPLASTLEELKAQTAALYFTSWLVDKKQITAEDAEKAHVRDIVWAFGHISQGMYDSDKHPHNYSQLAAIQLGWLMQNGAIAWKADETAANGKDKGCFSIALDKMPAAVKSLMAEVAQIKGKGDKPRAEKLMKSYVDVTGDKKATLDVISERVLRAPKPSFVYAIKVD
ncbi:MAG: Nudix hydrolase 3 [Myxococcaceae bacterium]|nr:Nudix hydrolase 3 [Myxococcaceae bacterium]